MNNKGTMENHIKETLQKTEAAYQTILAIMGNKYYNNIELETAWKLVETCIQPIITYGGESWNINKKEQKSLNRIQKKYHTTCTNGTPINTNRHTIYGNRAAGHIYHNDKNRLNMGKRIQKKPERLVEKNNE